MPEINGSNGNDNLPGTPENDIINGLGGNDVISADSGDDTIDGGDGDDQLYGEAGNDTIYGGNGFDSLLGAEGNDHLYGGADNDQLYGWVGDDYLDGGDGIDTLDGGFGNDTILGGAGDDAISNAIGADTIDGGTGFDFLDGVFWSGDTVTTFATASVNVDFSLLWAGGTLLFNGLSLTGIERIGHIGGSNFDDNIVLGAAVAGMQVWAYSGNDTVVGTGFDDTILGGNGNDILSGGDGADELRGDAGDDTLIGGNGDDLLYTGTGNSTELLTGGSGADRFLIEGGTTITITDYTDGIDKILLGYIGLGSSLQLAQSMVQTGNDVTITFGGHTLIIQNTLVSQLTASDFLGMLDQSFNPALVPQLPSLTGSYNFVVTNGIPPTVTNTGLLALDNSQLPPGFELYGYRNPFGVQDFSNSGTIIVQNYQGPAWGVHLGWVYGSASNSGSIYAYSYDGAYDLNSIAVGADVWGLGSFANSGLIAAYAVDRAIGVQRSNGGTLVNASGGTILAEGGYARAVAIIGVDTGTFVNGVLEHRAVENHGTIAALSIDPGTPSYGIYVAGGISGAQGAIRTFDNFGTITADVAIFVAEPPAQDLGLINLIPRDIVRNEVGGIINGAISLGLGDDQIINRGTINGTLLMGDGNDLVDNTAGALNGIADLGLGSDTYQGGNGVDAVFGDLGNDNLQGGGGNDLLVGGFSDDLIAGQAGNDGLYGDTGDDTLITLGGDFASGGRGTDRIEAGDLAFARVSGDLGFDTLALTGDNRVLDLAGAVGSGRIAGIERIDLNGAMGLAIAGGTISAMDALGNVIQVAGTGGGIISLVGSWVQGADRIDGSSVWHTYFLGTETVEVAAGRTVAIVATAPVGMAGLDAVAGGGGAPLPDGSLGLLANQSARLIDNIWLTASLALETGETLLSHSSGTAVSGGFGELDFTNHGAVVMDGAAPGNVTGLYNIAHAINHGLIDIYSPASVATGIQDSQLSNHGTIYVTSDRSAFPGTFEATAIGFAGLIHDRSGAAVFGELINTGTIDALATGSGAFSIGILAYASSHFTNGDPARGTSHPGEIFNSGQIIADVAIYVIRDPNVGGSDPTIGPVDIFNSGTIAGDVITNTGWDRIYNTGAIYGIVSLDGGNDLYDGRGGQLYGAVFGEAGNDTLLGGAGTDWFEGGAGDDAIDGGGGTDRALYSEASSAVNVDLRISGAQSTGGAGIDTLTSIEELFGSAHADSLIGNDSANILDGFDGDDLLTGGGGDDRIIGGNGSTDVAVFSGARASYLIEEVSINGVVHFRVTGQGAAAGDGIDLLSGVEVLRFTDQDLLIGNSRPVLGNAVIPDQNAGDGVLYTYQIPAGAFTDANGDPLSYSITLADGSALPGWLSFDPATRTLSGIPPQAAVGSQFEVRVTARDNAPGDPNSFATDTFVISIFLAPGADISGTPGVDVLSGTLRDERMFGLDGDDTFSGSAGADQIDGGNGFDLVDYSLSAGPVTINLATGSSGGDAQGDSYVSIEGARGSAYVDLIFGSSGNDSLFGMGSNDDLFGGDGNDLLDGGSGANYLHGDGGDDRLLLDLTIVDNTNWSFYDGGAGSDTLVVTTGGGQLFGNYAGLEAIEFTPGTSLTMLGGVFNQGFAFNTVVSGSGSLIINLTIGDYFFATQMNVASTVSLTVFGNDAADFSDVIKGPLGAAITVHAGGGADQVRGGNMVDTIFGDGGNDKIMGLGGADLLTGGAGADQFRYLFTTDSGLGANADRILDFTNGSDKLDFRVLDADPNTAGRQALSYIGNAAFATNGTAQVRYAASGADTLVQIDLNGDGAADMEIVLVGHGSQPLTGTDFLL